MYGAISHLFYSVICVQHLFSVHIRCFQCCYSIYLKNILAKCCGFPFFTISKIQETKEEFKFEKCVNINKNYLYLRSNWNTCMYIFIILKNTIQLSLCIVDCFNRSRKCILKFSHWPTRFKRERGLVFAESGNWLYWVWCQPGNFAKR